MIPHCTLFYEVRAFIFHFFLITKTSLTGRERTFPAGLKEAKFSFDERFFLPDKEKRP